MVAGTIVCEVAVIGAGLAGLAATDYLDKNGVNVALFEAASEAGGRVATKHLANGGHYELGAFSFTDAELTLWKYITRFSLTAVEHNISNKRYCCSGTLGKISDSGGLFGFPDALSTLASYYINRIDPSEDISLKEALAKAGATDAAIHWMQENSIIGLKGNSLSDLSAPSAMQYLAQYNGTKHIYAIKGGNDALPKALAKDLDHAIYYNTTIKKVTQVGKSVLLIGANNQMALARKVIFALPVAGLEQIELTPGLSPVMKEALSKVHYTSCSRVTLMAPPHYFKTEDTSPRGGVFATTDKLSCWIRDQTLFQNDPTQQTIINLSYVGQTACSIESLDPFAQFLNALKTLEEINALNGEDAEKIQFAFTSWNNVDWIRGGYSYFAPGTFHYKQKLQQPEGNYHFAGEHTSDKPASMNGALESGIRAAEEVLLALEEI